MKIDPTSLAGCFLIRSKVMTDNRGHFIKFFQDDFFQKTGINFSTREMFFTISHKDVLRGMHFQSPPHDHDKLVLCIRGSILDVGLDIRPNSPTYGQILSIELDDRLNHALFLPKGIAHGFLSKEDHSTVVYATSTGHNPEFDKGIRWDTFGAEWPCSAPVISERDASLPSFQGFINPF